MSERVLVTGAANGIGRATATSLCRAGWTVVALDREEEPLQTLREELGSSIEPMVLELGALSGSDDLGSQADVSAVVHCAATFTASDVVHSSPVEWKRVFDIDFHAAYLLNRQIVPYMIDRGAGAIVHVTSVHAWLSEALSSHYDAAKAALGGLTRTMAVELAPHGIRVNAIAPGFVRTRMSIYNGVDELQTPHFLEHYVGRRRIPLARAAEPDEIAGPILFLLSSAASYITGATLVVDGGLSVTF